MSGTVSVRPVQSADEATWRELWAGYLDFYQTSLPEAVTRATWERSLDPDSTYQAFVAERDGLVVGIANCVIHHITWTDRPVCLLHDLYVRPDVRGGGIGRALIDHVVELGKASGWARVYWLTAHDNATARRLYDTYAPVDPFVRYKITLD